MAYRLGASPTSVDEEAERLMLPSYEDVSTDPRAFAEMTRLAHLQSDPESARRLVQRHGARGGGGQSAGHAALGGPR